ncbi:hypothetical protein DEU56DRAFT_165606 [Suillus clintonianus]|uniref:uncharacterized protein n=1 Tax=Suillus clintonianus TaxID=1904413 RepID=UPI001B865F4D|nr:uncharacterized protein DEU56DRAFT_165606 [Suillus clintonianus]KAG2116376.1 hypothetical protein DEU56DRAFT_165606 [Suillus clintonianus]
MNQSLFEVGVQDYYQLLVDGQVLEELISPSTPDHPRCPICSHRLVTCHGCSSVTCDNGWCAGANLVRIVSSCQLCFSTLARSEKCSQGDCESRIHLTGGVICPDCVRPRDIVCPCGDTWVCGTCATEDKFLDNSGRCPKCQTDFCFSECKYIDVCPECKKTTLCNDCMELEDEDVHMSNEGTSITSKGPFPANRTTCTFCQHRLCADCYEEFEFMCSWCGDVHCRSHMEFVECVDCGAPWYWGCRGDWRCNRCQSYMEESTGTSDSESQSREKSVDSESTSSRQS